MARKGVNVHVHKCGGHTIKTILYGQGGRRNRYDCNTLAGPLHGQKRHQEYFPLYRWEIPDWDERFKFTMIRNPFDRLASAYRFFKKDRRYVDGSLIRIGKQTFLDFVTRITDLRLHHAVHAHEDAFDLNVFLKAHTAPFTSEGYYLDALDYIGRFEDGYEKCIQHIFDQLGHECPPIPHTHRTADEKTPHYSSYYCPKSRELAENYYWYDCLKYDYKFEEAA